MVKLKKEATKPVSKNKKAVVVLENIVLFPGTLDELNQFKVQYFNNLDKIYLSISLASENISHFKYAERIFKRKLFQWGYDGVIYYSFHYLTRRNSYEEDLLTLTGLPIKKRSLG